MFTPGQRVGVAVSGGADSVCLLLVLRELAPRWDLALSVLHLNHQLRGGESDADEEYVGELAARFGLELRSARADVLQIASATGDNLEQAARQARREFFLSFLGAGWWIGLRWGTRGRTRPKRCCSGSCAAPGRPAWPGCGP